MSRSRRRTPIIGNTCARSEKDDKRRANRTLRTHLRGALVRMDEVLPVLRDVSTTWLFAKDGKHWLRNRISPRRKYDPERWMRK